MAGRTRVVSGDRTSARADVTVEVAMLTVRSGRLHTLLVPRTADPQRGRWALPGRAKTENETLDRAATLAIEDGLGLDLDAGHLEQLASFGDPHRDPRGHVVSVAYLAFVPDVVLPTRGRAASARFWAIEDLADGYGPRLAFDHDRILETAVERARAKLEYTTLATRFVPQPFTIGDLYDVYRAVWGVDPGDKANFARKVKGTEGFLTETDRTAPNVGRGRPSMLFTSGPATHLHPPILRPAPVPS